MNIVITGAQVLNSFLFPILSVNWWLLLSLCLSFKSISIPSPVRSTKKCSKNAFHFKMFLLTWKQQLAKSALKIHHFHIKYRFYTSCDLLWLFVGFESLSPFLENNFHVNISNLLLNRRRDFEEFNEIDGMLRESWNKLDQHFDILEDIIQDTFMPSIPSFLRTFASSQLIYFHQGRTVV
jgi:hypothetical protein